MRVTPNLIGDSLVSHLNALTARQYHLQSQIASGLRVQAPSDDPTAMENVLSYKTGKAAQEQYGANVSAMQARANSIYSVLQSLQTLSNRVGEISTLAADPTKSPSDLNAYATEVSQLIQQAAQMINTKDSATGQYIFGGTKSNTQPFASTLDANGNPTAITYQGNTSVNQSEIAAGATLAVDVPGENISGSGPRGIITDSRSGADFFAHLISLRDNLLSNNKAAISATDAINLRKDEDNILFHISNNGALQSRLNNASAMASTNASSLDQMISTAANADIVQTMVELNEAQNAYQAALASGAKIMQLSLLDYV